MLKMVAKEIAPVPVLAFIFQQSYDTSQAHQIGSWQMSPQYLKRETRQLNPANYRPVSLTCILCKTMEHIVFSQIMSHLDLKKIFIARNDGYFAHLHI